MLKMIAQLVLSHTIHTSGPPPPAHLPLFFKSNLNFAITHCSEINVHTLLEVNNVCDLIIVRTPLPKTEYLVQMVFVWCLFHKYGLLKK